MKRMLTTAGMISILLAPNFASAADGDLPHGDAEWRLACRNLRDNPTAALGEKIQPEWYKDQIRKECKHLGFKVNI